MTIEVKHNLPNFRQELRKIQRQMATIAASGTGAGAREFAKAVRVQSVAGGTSPRKRTGTLRAAVVVKRARRVPRGEVMHIVGVRQGKSQQNVKRRRGGKTVSVNLDAYYWRWLESGFYPRRPGQALRGGKRTKALQRARAAARGEQKIVKPFIAPAFRRSENAALRVFNQRLDQEFAKIK